MWQSFCQGLSGDQTASTAPGEAHQLAYHGRIPRLTSRLGSVLADTVAASEAAEGRYLAHMDVSSPERQYRLCPSSVPALASASILSRGCLYVEGRLEQVHNLPMNPQACRSAENYAVHAQRILHWQQESRMECHLHCAQLVGDFILTNEQDASLRAFEQVLSS